MAILRSKKYKGDWSFEAGIPKHQRQLDNIIHNSFTAHREGKVVGLLFDHPVADGWAYYVVVKEKPLTLAWVPYLDAWELPAAHIRGLETDDIVSHVINRVKMRRLFE